MNHHWNSIYKCIWLCSFVIAFSGFNKIYEQDCARYKTGKFYIYNKVSRQKVNIERKDSLQIETNAETGDITVMKVKWTSACEYELLFNYMTPKDVAKSKNFQRVIETSADIPLRIKILSGTEEFYVFEAGKEGFKPLRDTVWLLKENASAFTK